MKLADGLVKATVYSLSLVIFTICLYHVSQVTTLRGSDITYSPIRTYVGFVYLVATVIYLFRDPYLKGYIFLVSGVVFFDSMDMVANIAFPHFVFTSYFLVWLFYFYFLTRKTMVASKLELLFYAFVLSTLIQNLYAHNKFLSVSFSTFNFGLLMFVAISTARVIEHNSLYNRSSVKIISATLLNMFVFSMFYFVYEVLTKHTSLYQQFTDALNRNYHGARFFTAGFMEPMGFSTMAAIFLLLMMGMVGTRVAAGDGHRQKLFDKLKYLGEYSLLKSSWAVLALLMYGLMLLILGNTISAYTGIIVAFVVFWKLRRLNKSDPIELNRTVKVMFAGLIYAAMLVVFYRAVTLFGGIAGKTFATSLSGSGDTSVVYVASSLLSVKYALSHFWGAGPFNLSGVFWGFYGPTASVNVFSYLFSLGAVYGWITAFLYATFVIAIYKSVKRCYRSTEVGEWEKRLSLIAASLIIASILPLGSISTPVLNWSPIVMNKPVAMCAELPPRTYQVLMVGVIYGIGLAMGKKRFGNRAARGVA